MSGDSGTGFLGRLKPDYDSVFVEEWSAYLGGIMVVLVMLGGVGGTFLVSGSLLLLWYVLVRYNESSGKFMLS